MPQPLHARHRRRWYALALLCTAQFMVVLDGSVINLALPEIARSFQVGQQELTWVVTSYVLAFGGFLLLGGRLADLLGRRRVFLFGLVLFGLASLAGGLADSVGMLIAARVAQGIGGAALSPAALSIITVAFAEGGERGRAFAAWGAVGGAGGAAGVILGGVLTQYAGWEWVLWINVPIVAVCLPLTFPLIDEEAPAPRRAPLDVAGAVTVTAGLTLLVYVLESAHAGWSALTGGAAAASVLLLAAFVLIELRSPSPLVDLRIFGNRVLTGANITGLLVGALVMPMFFFLSLHMQNVLGQDPVTAGLYMVPMTALSFLAAMSAAPWMLERLGAATTLTAGIALLGVGWIWFSLAEPQGTFTTDLLLPGLVAGAGLGVVFPALITAATTGVAPHQAGLASGLVNTGQQLGGAMGLAVLSGVSLARIGTDSGAGVEQLSAGYSAAFVGGAVIALAGLAGAAALIVAGRRRGDRVPA